MKIRRWAAGMRPYRRPKACRAVRPPFSISGLMCRPEVPVLYWTPSCILILEQIGDDLRWSRASGRSPGTGAAGP